MNTYAQSVAIIALFISSYSIAAEKHDKLQPKAFDQGLQTPLRGKNTLNAYLLLNKIRGTQDEQSLFLQTQIYKFTKKNSFDKGTYKSLGFLSQYEEDPLSSTLPARIDRFEKPIKQNKAIFCPCITFDEDSCHDVIIVGTNNIDHCTRLQKIFKDKERQDNLTRYYALNRYLLDLGQ